MLRPLSHLISAAVCLVVLLLAAPAGAEMVWDESGPPEQRGGLHAIALDPDDSEIVWVIDQSRVWVTDDGGSTWQVVMIVTGLRDSDDEDDSDEDDEDDSDEDFLDGSTDSDDSDEAAEATDDAESELETFDDASGRVSSAEPEEIAALVSVRLRVIGRYVYACTPVGLWRVPRTARTLGSDEEVRLPQSRAVLDVAPYNDGGLLVGTSAGLLELTESGQAVSLFEQFGRRAVTSLLVEDGHILAGTAEGLWLDTGFGFEALNVGARGGVPQDIVRVSPTLVAVATGGHVIVLDIRDEIQIVFVPVEEPATEAPDSAAEEAPAAAEDTEGDEPPVATAPAAPGERVEVDLREIDREGEDPAATAREVMAWKLRVRRLAIDRDGAVWAAGSGSVFRWKPGTARWEQMDHTLDDRRLSDVAAPPKGVAHVWVTGRGGAHRWIPERVHLVEERARRGLSDLLPGIPSASELVAAAERARYAERGQVATMATRQLLSHLMPDINMRLRYDRDRHEVALRVAELDRDLITGVAAAPHEVQFQVYALWDLMPAILMMTGSGGRSPTVANRLTRTAKLRRGVRDIVVGRYGSWTQKLVHVRAGQPESVGAAIHEILDLQHLEADLYALTAGAFQPITTLDTFSKPPPG